MLKRKGGTDRGAQPARSKLSYTRFIFKGAALERAAQCCRYLQENVSFIDTVYFLYAEQTDVSGNGVRFVVNAVRARVGSGRMLSFLFVGL